MMQPAIFAYMTSNATFQQSPFNNKMAHINNVAELD